jgi:hypothetical protein
VTTVTVTVPELCRNLLPPTSRQTKNENVVFSEILVPIADPSGRAVQGVGLRPLAYWNCGFESRLWHGCLSLVSVVRCQVEVSATSWSLVQRRPTECGMSKSVIVKPRKMRRPRPPRGCRGIAKKIGTYLRNYTPSYLKIHGLITQRCEHFKSHIH